jgi:hypothetical protein
MHPRRACVIDEDIEAAELLERGGRQLLRARLATDVRRDKGRARRRLCVARARSDDYLGAAIKEALRDGCADTFGAARDERATSTKFLRQIESGSSHVCLRSSSTENVGCRWQRGSAADRRMTWSSSRSTT